MIITKLFNTKLINLQFSAKNKKQAINKLCKLAYENKIVTDAINFEKDIMAREQQGTTGIGDGIAIPHNRSKYVKKPAIIFARITKGLEWESLDNKPVKLIFLIAMPYEGDDTHLKALATLSSYLIDQKNIESLLHAKKPEDVLKVFGPNSKVPEESFIKETIANVVAVTACPTGIAHTYMAQEKLEFFAKQLNVKIKVETQGRSGLENALTMKDIDNAQAIIIAADKNIEGLERFSGRKVLQVKTKDAIASGAQVIQNAIKGGGEIIKTGSIEDPNFVNNSIASWKVFRGFYKHIMTGVSRMLPFVVAGGIILGIGFLLDSGNSGNNFGTIRSYAGWFSALGKLCMSMMVPVLAGFITYSLVGWQGLLPGFITGLMADSPSILYWNDNPSNWENLWGRLIPEIKIGSNVLEFNSGFIGAIIGGYIAGIIVFSLMRLTRKVPSSIKGVKDIVFIPLLSVLIMGVIMFALNVPLGLLNWGLKEGITRMYEIHLHILVGVIVAAMMAVDMGGPINKAAYVLGTTFLKEGVEGQRIMASVMAGGMTPPLVIALTTLLFKQQYTIEERNAGISNWFMGLSFITEGAIPFVATRPKKVLPTIIISSAITGALVMLFQVSLPAPHGGIFVFALLKTSLVNEIGMSIGLGISLYISAIIIGVIFGALLLGFLNSNYFTNKFSKK